MRMKNHLQINSFALSLALKQRLEATRKRPIRFMSILIDINAFQDGTDALICENINGQVSVEHYMADKGYGQPSKSNPVSILY